MTPWQKCACGAARPRKETQKENELAKKSTFARPVIQELLTKTDATATGIESDATRERRAKTADLENLEKYFKTLDTPEA